MTDEQKRCADAWIRWARETHGALLPEPVARVLAKTGVWP